VKRGPVFSRQRIKQTPMHFNRPKMNNKFCIADDPALRKDNDRTLNDPTDCRLYSTHLEFSVEGTAVQTCRGERLIQTAGETRSSVLKHWSRIVEKISSFVQ